MAGPRSSAVVLAEGVTEPRPLQLGASAEQYSRHPLAFAVTQATPTASICRAAGGGAPGRRASRRPSTDAAARHRAQRHQHDPAGRRCTAAARGGGLECIVLVDGSYAGTLLFRDEPRIGAKEFIAHLEDRHQASRTLLLSGDRTERGRLPRRPRRPHGRPSPRCPRSASSRSSGRRPPSRRPSSSVTASTTPPQ